MKYALHMIVALVLIVLASSIAPLLPDPGLMPCVAVPVVVYIAMLHPLKASLLLALSIGYLVDRFTLAPTGFHGTLLTWVALLVRFASINLNLDNQLSAMALSSFSQALASIGGYILLLTLTGHAAFSSALAALQLPAMVMCGLLPLVTWPLQKLIDRPAPETGINLLAGKR